MRAKDREFVGIEICPDEVRAVYLRNGDNGTELVAASRFPMPFGAVAHGAVSQPEIVADSLKSLLKEMQVPPGASFVMGIHSEGIVVRTLNVPPAPEDELATIVAGEVAHYNMLRSNGSHAFVNLRSPGESSLNSPQTVVVAAAEGRITKSIGETVSLASLRLLALEPVEFGMLRAAAATLTKDEPAFLVVIGQESTDLAAFSRGELCSYRRLDCGAVQLLPSLNHRSPLRLADDSTETQAYSEAALATLCTEIGRSIAYLGREYQEDAQFAKLRVCIGDGALADIAPHISKLVACPVDIAVPWAGVGISNDVAAKLEGAEAARYTAAFGLAMRESVMPADTLPRIDLFTAERAKSEAHLAQRNLIGSLAMAFTSIAIGLTGSFLYGRQISSVETQTNVARAHQKSLQAEGAIASEKHQARLRQIGLLSEYGVPAQALMDAIATSIDKGVGIQTLTINQDRTMTLAAEATSEDRMLNTVKRVQSIPILQDVMVQTFSNKGSQNDGLTFTITAKSLPLSQVDVVPSLEANASVGARIAVLPKAIEVLQ